jgi:REP element-mobilizing transposase RayT
LFGKIANGLMVLNGLGKIVEEELLKTEEIRQYVNIDYYCIMPNHIHFILIINENCMDIASRVPTESFGKPVHNSLPTIIRSIKSAITKRINEIRNTPGNSVWHHGFYEHIIRNEQELHEIRQYIENNPINWQNDEYRD